MDVTIVHACMATKADVGVVEVVGGIVVDTVADSIVFAFVVEWHTPVELRQGLENLVQDNKLVHC